MLRNFCKQHIINSDLGQLLHLSRVLNFKFRGIVVGAFLSASASFLEGASMVLLIPTLRGIISRDFTFIAGVPALSYYFAFFPEHYRHNYFFLSANLVGFVFAVLVAKVVFCFISGLIVSSIIRDFGNELRKLIFKRYLQFGKLFFDRHSLGFLQQVLTTYVYQVANVLGTANELIYAVTTLIVYVGVMLYISWQLTLVFLALVPILYFAYNWLVRKIHRSSHYYSESYGVLAATISNAVSCIGLVKAYTAEARESETFSHTSDHVAELEFSIDKKRLAIGPSGELIILFFLFILVAIIAYILNGHPSETAMDYLVFLLVLKRAVTTYTGINIVRAAIAGVSGPLDEIRRMLADEEKFFVPDGTREFPGLSGPLELRDLSFSFPNGAAVLKSVNIKVLPGEVAAIVGASGSGKTTIINLLMRYYDPPVGAIFVQGIDVREFTLESWRARIALVSQESFLFNGTLRANLLYGLPREVSEDELVKVLTRARLTDLLRQLPDGLDTQIGDRGVNLSGGERQRVSIARAFLKGAEILLLDEATSALDSTTEGLIQQALSELIAGRTSVVIAHRLSTVRNADHIFVIEDGCVAESGSPADLLARKGKFYAYWQEQYGGYDGLPKPNTPA